MFKLLITEFLFLNYFEFEFFVLYILKISLTIILNDQTHLEIKQKLIDLD
jgi:hypothetical protein